MRLFGIVSGAIDRRDRAMWLTAPFDRLWRLENTPHDWRVAAGQAPSATALAGFAFSSGASAAQSYTSGAIASEVTC